jgi:hypothetical protein
MARMAIKYLDDRCIAMLDVLGFSDRITNKKRILKTLNKYNQIIAQSKEHLFRSRSSLGTGKHDLHFFAAAEFVFDTLILVSDPIDGNKGRCGAFIGGIAGLMTHFAASHMPLRGVLGIGDYAADDSSNIFVSNIFARLITAEKQQEWSGCYVLPEFQDRIHHLLHAKKPHEQTQAAYLLRYDVQLKKGVAENVYCINWLADFREKDLPGLLEFLGAAPVKQANTKAFAEYYRSLPNELHDLPPEFWPAVKVSMCHTDQLSRYRLRDSLGNPTIPGCRHFKHDPRIPNSLHAFVGSNSIEEERIRETERWKPYGRLAHPAQRAVETREPLRMRLFRRISAVVVAIEKAFSRER